jgi:Uma2 family endonuclease
MLFDFTAMVQRKRRPDVAFVSYERWPRQRPVPHAEAWEVVPNLVVEVISPSDKGKDILHKVAEYFRIGVECVWVIFIFQEQVYIYESPTQVRILTRADELYGEPVLPHFRLPLATLFEDIEAAEPPQQTASQRRETAS